MLGRRVWLVRRFVLRRRVGMLIFGRRVWLVRRFVLWRGVRWLGVWVVG